MNKLVLFFITIVFIAGCNNSKSPDAVAASSATSTENEVSSGVDCSSVVWFKKGTVMVYDMTNGKGVKSASTTTTINDVRNEGGAVFSDYTTTFGDDKKIDASYKCEGNKIYVNMKEMFGNMFSSLKTQGLDVEVDEAFLTLPWDMKTGDALDQGVFRIRAKQDGKDFMTMTSIVKDRKVEGMENLTTAAGTWDCIKLKETRSTTTEMMGKKVNETDVQTVQWYHPKAGLVKSVSYDDKGEINFQTELVSLK